MSQKYEKLKSLLKELFQLDQPDLDFGLYRIMHAKSAEVTQFLDKDLLPQVQAAFALYKTADKAEIEKELAKVIAGIEAAGMEPDQSPRVKDLRAKLKSDAVDVGGLESEVYDHLFNFFRRYYSEGDYLSRRVYKPGVYAIPYEGEEVKLHWANADQYYIKTSEYLRDYAFRLRPDDDKAPLRVHFRLVDVAEGEHGNVKAAEGKDRAFVLASAGASGRDFIAEEDGDAGKELVVHFEYRPATLGDWADDVREGKTKPPTQKDLTAYAVKRILGPGDASLAAWIAELSKPHVLANGERADYSRIEAHLRRYTARNTFDYFIHKDLGGFLRRELDFYIKNEVMHLDDVENESAPRVEQYLSKIKIVRRTAGKIIDFLAQLEDFQRKLWLKKKFVVETSWRIRVGCIPVDFYPEIAANERQRAQWLEDLAIDRIAGDLALAGYSAPMSTEFIAAHPTLVIDTRNFDSNFSARLLSAFDNLDQQIDGVVVQSDNFQALSLLRNRYRERVQCAYIDPPYNTGSDSFIYKDGYQHSSWLSALFGSLSLSRDLLVIGGAHLASIDDHEQRHLWELLGQVFGDANRVSPFIWKRKAGGSDDSQHLASEHEYVLIAAKSAKDMSFGRIQHESPSMTAKYNKVEDGRRYYLERLDKPSLPYVPSMDFPIPAPDKSKVWPPQPDPSRRTTRWRWGSKKAKEDYKDLVFLRDASAGEWRVYTKTWEPGADGVTARSMLVDAETHGRNRDGTEDLSKLFGAKVFNNPKPVKFLAHLLSVAAATEDDDGVITILDYFAGSGSTAHAVIKLNRDDGLQRRFILIEMGDHCESVIIPRLSKVTFSPEWKDGIPKRMATAEEAERSPRIVKVVRLESYEDALNNLETRRTDSQVSLLDGVDAEGADGLKEQYILRYMLEVESRGSQSLLNVQALHDPTAYKLKVKRRGSDESQESRVDLLETFNWLIGLRVWHIAVPRTFNAAFVRDDEKRLALGGRLKQDASGPWWFRTVTGTIPDGRKALVVWRKLTGNPEEDNLVLDEWFTRQGYSSKDSEFDLIYVNGGNNLENLKAPDDTWKVRLIEEDFHRLMFETEGL